MIDVFIYNRWYKGFNHQYLLLRLLLLSFSFEEPFEAALDSHNCPHFDLHPAQRQVFCFDHDRGDLPRTVTWTHGEENISGWNIL